MPNYSGVWSLVQQMQGVAAGTWPRSPVFVDGSPVPSGTYIYNLANSARVITVGGATPVTFRIWGAAGGNGMYGTLATGSGAGGFAKGTVTLQPGTNYYLYIGEGGKPTTAAGSVGGLGGWPNGGYGSMGDASGGGGGGMTMLSKAVFSVGMSDSDILLIAGAGGGSTGYAGQAGAGGGSTGQNSAAAGITGGSQSAGGTYNGAKLTGGNAVGPRTVSTADDGGGGGGGYYGGGGGTGDGKPAAGGSGYFNPTLVTSASLVASSGLVAADPDALLLAGYASGKSDSSSVSQTSNNGLVYITY